MHEAAVADRSEQEWELEIEAQNAGAEAAIGERDGVARAEGNVLIHAAIFAEGNFALGASVEVIEDGFGHTALGDGAEV
jgi:hypothetical protein